MTCVKNALCVVAVAALAACAATTGTTTPAASGRTVNVSLTGAEQVPPAATQGSGRGSFVVGSDGSVSGSVTTSGVRGTLANLHRGGRRQRGPVVLPLEKRGDTYTVPAGAKLGPADLKAFQEGRLYVNVHSDRFKAGEVRGQLVP